MDREGYGYGDHQSLIDRLLGDLRTLGPSGIERIADGFRRFESERGHDRYHELERKALHDVEAERSDDWEQLKAQIHHLTEGGGSLLSWKTEHGDTGHLAEAAVLGAALALLDLTDLPRDDFLALVDPLGEALPWVRAISPDGTVSEAPEPPE